MGSKQIHDIVFIDTGFSRNSKSVGPANPNYDTISFDVHKHGHTYNTDIDAYHGPSVIELFHKKVVVNGISVLAIEIDNTIESLLNAIQYIIKNEKPRIVQISAGILQSDRLVELFSLVSELSRKSLIVCSFDNYGGLSYPAALRNVLSVDIGPLPPNKEFIVKNDSVVDFVFRERFYSVTIGGHKTPVKGSSYAASILSAMILNDQTCTSIDLTDVKTKLAKENQQVYIDHDRSAHVNEKLLISRAVAFPYNKEIYSLVANNDLLVFDLQGVYDHRFSARINHYASEHLRIANNRDYVVKSIEDLKWDESFDTFILGHCEELSELYGRDYLGEISRKCQQNGKQLISFSQVGISCPENPFVHANTEGKLHLTSWPVIGVWGTSSKQGKYHVQLGLRRELLYRGYRVGQIGTEPSAALFGMTYTYPMGYMSPASEDNDALVTTINHMIQAMEFDQYDIVIIGGQSMILPHDKRNIKYLNLQQDMIVQAAQCDFHILVVNGFAEIEYIERAINYLESIDGGQVGYIVFSDIIQTVDSHIVEDKRAYIEKTFGIQSAALFDDLLFRNMVDTIEKRLGE